MPIVSEPVTLQLRDGRPTSLRWRDATWHTSDEPTWLGDVPDAILGFATHPPLAIPAWRFQATTAAGETLVFDVRLADGHWMLARVYS